MNDTLKALLHGAIIAAIAIIFLIQIGGVVGLYLLPTVTRWALTGATVGLLAVQYVSFVKRRR